MSRRMRRSNRTRKPALEAPAIEAPATEPTPKRGPGRPAGSPNATPRYESGEHPQACRACGSANSTVLRTDRYPEQGRTIRRRLCACGTVWLSYTPLEL